MKQTIFIAMILFIGIHLMFVVYNQHSWGMAEVYKLLANN